MVFCRERAIARSILRLTCCCLSLGLLMFLVGCRNARSVQHAEVSGRVLFQGNPLPGGTVNFVSLIGGFANAAVIDENGNYHINSPVGEVEIGVSNKMLAGSGGLTRDEAKGPKTLRDEKASGQKKKGPLVKGRYVPIPKKYLDPHTSGLRYTVKPGSQTYDIELSDNPP